MVQLSEHEYKLTFTWPLAILLPLQLLAVFHSLYQQTSCLLCMIFIGQVLEAHCCVPSLSTSWLPSHRIDVMQEALAVDVPWVSASSADCTALTVAFITLCVCSQSVICEVWAALTRTCVLPWRSAGHPGLCSITQPRDCSRRAFSLRPAEMLCFPKPHPHRLTCI